MGVGGSGGTGTGETGRLWKSSLWGWALSETIGHDRDLVLAHSLQRPKNAQKIVGVVGAGQELTLVHFSAQAEH